MDIRVIIDRKLASATLHACVLLSKGRSLRTTQQNSLLSRPKQYMEESQSWSDFRRRSATSEIGPHRAQSAKQVILQKVREAERDRQYEEFKDQGGTIINGVVKREEYGNVIVDVGSRRRRSCAVTKNWSAKAIAERSYPLLHQRCTSRSSAVRRFSCPYST